MKASNFNKIITKKRFVKFHPYRALKPIKKKAGEKNRNQNTNL